MQVLYSSLCPYLLNIQIYICSWNSNKYIYKKNQSWTNFSMNTMTANKGIVHYHMHLLSPYTVVYVKSQDIRPATGRKHSALGKLLCLAQIQVYLHSQISMTALHFYLCLAYSNIFLLFFLVFSLYNTPIKHINFSYHFNYKIF